MSVIIPYLMRITHKNVQPIWTFFITDKLPWLPTEFIGSMTMGADQYTIIRPKLWTNWYMKIICKSLVVSVSFPEATGRLSHGVGLKIKETTFFCEDRSSSGTLTLYNCVTSPKDHWFARHWIHWKCAFNSSNSEI